MSNSLTLDQQDSDLFDFFSFRCSYKSSDRALKLQRLQTMESQYPQNLTLHSDYRSLLKGALTFFQEKNSRFSQAALARKLQMSPSMLSEILKGKKNLTMDKALEIAPLLKMTTDETIHLCHLVALDLCTDPDQKQKILNEIDKKRKQQERQKLSLDLFTVFSRWECVAILEILAHHSEQPFNFYAQALNISITSTEKAFIDLQSIGLIQKTENGFVRKSSEILVSSETHNLALKLFHSSMLEKAKQAIFQQSPQIRFTGTETLMIDPDLIPEAHLLMNECLDQLLNLFAKSKNRTTLVHAQFNFFTLTQELTLPLISKKSKQEAS